MARAGIKSTKMLLMKPFSVPGLRGRSKIASPTHRTTSNKDMEAAAEEGRDAGSWWMPHPRTGIYFPKGQEWVMDDIPNDAASLDCTVWFRSIDGVDDHKPDDHFPHNYPGLT